MIHFTLTWMDKAADTSVDGDGSDDPTVPAFFLSYARARNTAMMDDDANVSVRRLFSDLTKNLIQLLPLPPGQDIGFMDTALEAGSLWEPELLRLVGTCKVFVALLSEPYLFRSEWCAMEWDLFSQRTVLTQAGQRPAGGHSKAMIPVLWAPVQRDTPKMAGVVQRFTPKGLPSEYLTLYASEGLLGTMETHPAAYRAIMWRLARAIQVAWGTYDVEPRIETNTDGLRRSFAGDPR